MDSTGSARAAITAALAMALFAAVTGCGATEVQSRPEALTTCTTAPQFAGLTSVSNDQAATCGTHLSWSAATASCGGTIRYSVYRGTSADFVPGKANQIATGISSTSFADNLWLTSGQRYWYVVRATETSSSATIEDTNTVVRSTAPTGGAVVPTRVFFDDFDSNRPANPSAWWSANAPSLRIIDGCHYQSASHAYRFGAAADTCADTDEYPVDSDAILQFGGTDGLAIPSDATRATFSFSMWYQLENEYDYAYLFLGPADGGPGNFELIAYWTGADAGSNGALHQESVDLTGYAGRKARLMFEFVTDSIIVDKGVYLDDVRVDVTAPSVAPACTTYSPPTLPAASFAITGLPASSTAGTQLSLSLAAKDVLGRTVTTYSGTAPIASTDSTATLPAPVPFSNGAASASVVLRRAGTQSVTVSDSVDPTIKGAASTSIVASAPVEVKVTTQPSTVPAGAPLPPVKVAVVDQFGNVVASPEWEITLSLVGGTPGATLAGTLTQTTVGGVATFADLSLARAGTGYTITATESTFGSVVTNAFDVLPGAAVGLIWTVEPTGIRAGAAFPDAPRVALVDAFQNVVPSSALVSVALSSGGTGLTGTTNQVLSNGVATFSGLSVTRARAGEMLVAATAGVPDSPSAPFDVSAAAPEKVRFDVQPGAAVAGIPFSPAVSVSVVDAFDNLAETPVDVQLRLASNSTGASLLGTSAKSGVVGTATFEDLAVDRAGQGFLLFATAPGLFAEQSAPFDVSAGAAAGLAFTVPPPSVIAAGTPFAVAVRLLDGLGNPVAEGASVTVSLALQGGAGTLSGTTSAQTVDGVATFTALSIDKAGAGLTLVATLGSTSTSSLPFSVVNGSAARLEVVLGSPVKLGQPVTVTVTSMDASGNIARDDQRSVVLTSSDARAQLPASVALYDGRAQATVVFGTAGNQTLTATLSDDPSIAGSQSVSVAPTHSGCNVGGGAESSAYGLALVLLQVVAGRRGRRSRSTRSK